MKSRIGRLVLAASLFATSFAVGGPALAAPTAAQQAYCAFWRDYLTIWPFKESAYRRCMAQFD